MNWKPGAHLSALARSPERVALAVVAGGIVARVYLFLLGRSFWLDEAKLALNVVRRSIGGLLLPLDFDQAAPVGFLVLSKAMITLFGNSDFILRILPLAAGCIALYLMYRLCFDLLPPVAALLSVIFFTLGKFMLYYATEYKQYSVDVVVVLVVSLLTLRMIRSRPSRKAVVQLALAGVAALLFSFPSVFVLAGAGTVLLVHYWRLKESRLLSGLVAVAATWAVVFGAMVLLILNHTSGNSELQSYWQSSFMPLPPWSDPLWAPSRVAALFINPAGFYNGGPVTAMLYLLLAVAGGFSFLRRNWQAGLLLILPVAFALAASALHRYPFAERLMLWAVPALILVAVEGAWWLLGRLRNVPRVQRIAWAAIVALILASPVRDAAGDVLNPKARQHIKPLLAHLRSHHAPGDLIYVYHKSRSPFLYYYPFYDLSPTDFLLGTDFHGNADSSVQEIGSIEPRGRIWILFSHVSPAGMTERDGILARLGESGNLHEVFRERSASLWLFDSRAPGPGGI